jgi:hypothetical protein
MVKRLRTLIPVVLVVTLLPWVTACEDTEEPQFPTITGSWEGTSGEITMALSIFEGENGVIDGSGTISSQHASFPFRAQGGHLFPDVSLTLDLTGESEQLAFDGVVAFDAQGVIPEMDASVTGGGFDRFPITLARR